MPPFGVENWTILLPELALVAGAVLLLLLDMVSPGRRGAHFAVVTFFTLVAAAVLTLRQWAGPELAGLGTMVVQDAFGAFSRWLILGAAGLATLTAHGYLRPRELDKAEFYALLLLSTTGMTLLAVSSDLVMVFLSVELLSLSLYVMAGFERTRPAAQEASMKYFLLGAFASAFLLYGIAFVFGGSGTTNLIRLKTSVTIGGLDDFRLIGLAVALLAVGLGFKAAMVPFHMWTPDAYQGAPTPVTAFMAGGTKVAAFAALLRILVGALSELRWDWQPPLAVMAVLTIAFASVLAVAQTDLKRMLAYSSIAHAGFVAMAVVAASRSGLAAALLYLLVYTAMTIGAFGSVMLFREGTQDGAERPLVTGERVHLGKYSGLGVKRPAAAALFAFFLFSLAGIPPTGGFWAKWYVFFAALRAHYAWLAIAAVLASVVAAFFYVRVAVVMFMQDPPEGDDMPLDRSIGLRLALAVCALVVIGVGVAPDFFLSLAERAADLAG